MGAQSLHHALLCPEAYPEESGPISYRETHISRLYFTAQYVYKVKKAVDFGFLNFTSLDRRRFYCHEEVRLNSRFCPGTYLGVVEIRQEEGRIAVNGPGEIVDYAVHMKRLPEDRMLLHLLRRDDPSLVPEMTRLARRLARLHQESVICRKNGGSSNLEMVKRNWRENFSQTLPFAKKTLSAQTIELCTHYVSRFFEAHSALLLEREAKGFVREGHGDLHAEHICLTDSVCIYDCIEFNRRFRVADLASDLAFLLMDLDFRGRRDLAHRVLEDYCTSMGEDRDLSILLPFYKIYRAYVRGKVESFLGDDTSADAATRQQATIRAKRYFNLALGYLCPPAMILTCGLMGVGKTTVAKRLADSLGAVLLRSDELRKELCGLATTERDTASFGQGIYTPEQTRQTYDLLLQKARAFLAGGKTVIVDASFAHHRERERFRKAAKELGIPFFILFMECDAQTAINRLDRRKTLGVDASDGRRELYASQAAVFHPLPENGEIIRVDTGLNVDYNVNLILCSILQRVGMPP